MDTDPFILAVSRSLNRTEIAPPPPPPMIDPAAVRLVGPARDLAARFVETAAAAKLHVWTGPGDPAAAIVALLKGIPLRSAVVTRSPLVDRLGLLPALRDAGIDARYWDESTLDAVYDVDVGITDAYAAVAETGSVVVRSSPAHGRAVSLVPPYHVAIVERSQIVPDLVDLFAKLSDEGTASGVVIITGPSKTADIEMNLVVGVHGPGEVHVFLV